MLLTTRIVHVPAPEEVDADLAEFGCTSTTTRARYGAAAIDAGDADAGVSTPEDAATDTIANVLHHCAREGLDPEAVVRRALDHFTAEAS